MITLFLIGLLIREPTFLRRSQFTDETITDKHTNSKYFCLNSMRLLHQNAKFATNKLGEVQLISEDLHTSYS